MNGETAAMPQHGRRRSTAVVVMAIVIIMLAAVCVLLFIRFRQEASKQALTPAAQSAKLMSQLGTEIDLPSERPVFATVLDRTKLGNPQLASEAHNGDQLLVYAAARRVILYRPSTHKVIDMFHVEAAAANATHGVTQTK